ncbi:MAG: hypothetical protein U0457_03025 [Candidatus Sericytochromatia bacterium]
MGFKELVEGASNILSAKYDYSEEKNVYSISIEYEDSSKQLVNVYQDLFENEQEGISKKIIVCESTLGKYDSSKNINFLSKSNNDFFFSKAYISEDDQVLVENCSFMEGLNDLNLSVIISEVAEHASILSEKI